MTCKPILVFLEENGIAPTRENKKRWQADWTIAEIKEGREFIEENFIKNFERETGLKQSEIDEKKRKENEKKIRQAIEKEKIRRKKSNNLQK
jgi:hypothetical protein|nr:MAG TPA: hypothetical protein [Caudoviricetes sp.]